MDYPLHDFSLLTEDKFINIPFTTWEISRLIKSLTSKKATGPDKIQVVV